MPDQKMRNLMTGAVNVPVIRQLLPYSQHEGLYPEVLVSVLCCDRKYYSVAYALRHLQALDYPGRKHLYFNFQCDQLESHYRELPNLLQILRDTGWTVHEDYWSLKSSWLPKAKFDQDQTARLYPICMARNMAMQFASWNFSGDYMLLVDADVGIPPDSIQRLLEVFEGTRHDYGIGEINLKLPNESGRPRFPSDNLEAFAGSSCYFAGGLVPGRNADKHINYIADAGKEVISDTLTLVNTSTLGFLMLRRPTFQYMRFYYGPSMEDRNCMLSEDPSFGEMGRRLGFGKWHINTTLKATHMDNPLDNNPLDASETARGPQF